jgi:membrane protein
LRRERQWWGYVYRRVPQLHVIFRLATPGGMIGIFGWLLASMGLRVYLHYFNSYSDTYGSLGAVIILLNWFYITGLMLLLGTEINSEIEAAVLKMHGTARILDTTDTEIETAE